MKAVFKLRNDKAVLRLKGGSGSGFHGHSGRPGKVGGSSAGGGASYDRDRWTSQDIPTRAGEWKKLSINERDAIADAKHSIPDRISKVLEFAGDPPEYDGDIKGAISKRVNAMKELITPQAMQMIESTVSEYDDVLEGLDVDPEDRHKLVQHAIDTLAVQDNESYGRQLGDHGINHIRGNIDAAMQMLSEHPGEDSSADKAKVFISSIYHDTGYLAPPSHDFIDEGHPRWSMQHYDANVRPMIEDALGSTFAGDVSHVIRTHDSTDVDWSGDVVGTSIRMADNTSLFQKEKLPPVFRYVPGNIALLEKAATKEISIDVAKTRMLENIDKTSFAPKIKSELRRGVKEISPATPKFTLGMLGGDITKFKWRGDHMTVHMRANRRASVWQKLLDLGQRQFGKFAEAYGVDPKDFMQDLHFTLRDSEGSVVLESVIE